VHNSRANNHVVVEDVSDISPDGGVVELLEESGNVSNTVDGLVRRDVASTLGGRAVLKAIRETAKDVKLVITGVSASPFSESRRRSRACLDMGVGNSLEARGRSGDAVLFADLLIVSNCEEHLSVDVLGDTAGKSADSEQGRDGESFVHS
jgi:hypothetical protein